MMATKIRTNHEDTSGSRYPDLSRIRLLLPAGAEGEGMVLQGQRFEPNSVLLSDMHINFQDQTFRVTDLYCLPDLSRCQATFQGQIIEFTPDEDSDAEGEIYQTLGEWGHMRTAALYAQLQGFQARYAVAGGVTYPNSIPRGTATWSGDMVGLDSNNRVIRGGAFVQLTDFGDPRVDVRLTPQSYAAMEWTSIPLRDGVYSQSRFTGDYIRGEFYGPNAEETGGVFERNQIVGAFGASGDSQ